MSGILTVTNLQEISFLQVNCKAFISFLLKNKTTPVEVNVTVLQYELVCTLPTQSAGFL